MKWCLEYKKCTTQDEAFEQVKKNITAETIKKFQVRADVSYDDGSKNFKAKGRGFELNADFGETSVDLVLNLSFLLKPAGKKVKAILDKELVAVL